MLSKYRTRKFDQTVEIAIRLGIDPKQADQIVRGSIVLPNGIGKSKRVVVFAKGAMADQARPAALLRPTPVAIHDDGDMPRDRAVEAQLVEERRHGGGHTARISASFAFSNSSTCLLASSVCFCTSFSARVFSHCRQV